MIKPTHWKGKVPFEEYVTEQLYTINEQLKVTNALLAEIANKEITANEVIDNVSSDSQDSYLSKLSSGISGIVEDVLDDGIVNNSVKKYEKAKRAHGK